MLIQYCGKSSRLMVNTLIYQTALIEEYEHTNYMTEIYFISRYSITEKLPDSAARVCTGGLPAVTSNSILRENN